MLAADHLGLRPTKYRRRGEHSLLPTQHAYAASATRILL